MELYKELLIEILKHDVARVEFPHVKTDAAEIIDSVSYRALEKIKEIIEDEQLGDKECFEKIEKIVQLFESIGSSGGTRHDFG